MPTNKSDKMSSLMAARGGNPFVGASPTNAAGFMQARVGAGLDPEGGVEAADGMSGAIADSYKAAETPGASLRDLNSDQQWQAADRLMHTGNALRPNSAPAAQAKIDKQEEADANKAYWAQAKIDADMAEKPGGGSAGAPDMAYESEYREAFNKPKPVAPENAGIEANKTALAGALPGGAPEPTFGSKIGKGFQGFASMFASDKKAKESPEKTIDQLLRSLEDQPGPAKFKGGYDSGDASHLLPGAPQHAYNAKSTPVAEPAMYAAPVARGSAAGRSAGPSGLKITDSALAPAMPREPGTFDDNSRIISYASDKEAKKEAYVKGVQAGARVGVTASNKGLEGEVGSMLEDLGLGVSGSSSEQRYGGKDNEDAVSVARLFPGAKPVAAAQPGRAVADANSVASMFPGTKQAAKPVAQPVVVRATPARAAAPAVGGMSQDEAAALAKMFPQKKKAPAAAVVQQAVAKAAPQKQISSMIEIPLPPSLRDGPEGGFVELDQNAPDFDARMRKIDDMVRAGRHPVYGTPLARQAGYHWDENTATWMNPLGKSVRPE